MSENYFSSFSKNISKLIGSFDGRKFHALNCSEIKNPKSIEDHVIYIISSGGHKKWIQLRCPCGCGEIILLNLSSSRRPTWRVRTTYLGRVTISPSIWRTEGCKSHFFIRDGKIDWCPKAYDGTEFYYEPSSKRRE
jgi:hypothetical protein